MLSDRKPIIDRPDQGYANNDGDAIEGAKVLSVD